MDFPPGVVLGFDLEKLGANALAADDLDPDALFILQTGQFTALFIA